MATTMADLMAQMDNNKLVNLSRGDEVEGKVVSITDSEIFLDLGSKNEGMIPKKELTKEAQESIKVGDTLPVFIILVDNIRGQTIVSLSKGINLSSRTRKNPQLVKKWQRVISAQKSKSTISGEVIEQNKGGFLVEVEGLRGFLPGSQLSATLLSQSENLTGREIPLKVIEVDEQNNKLIFSAVSNLKPEVLESFSKIEVGQNLKASVIQAFSFGVFLLTPEGVEVFVKPMDATWERVEDLGSLFKTGTEVEGKVVGVDEVLNRVFLSLKSLTEDPFEKLSENFQIDDVVTGEVVEVTPVGVRVNLEGGVEGLLTSESGEFQIGQKTNFLVSGVDLQRRRINLSPFITSTVGLIYK